MGDVKIRYLVKKRVAGKTIFYWQPKRFYRVEGKPFACPVAARRIASSNKIEDAVVEAEQLNAQLDRWLTGRDVGKSSFAIGTFGWMVGKYRADARFSELRDTTKKLYSYMFPRLIEIFGDIPCQAITRQQVRAFYEVFAEKKRTAHQLLTTGRIVMNFGRDFGYCENNPFENMRISKGSKRETLWTQDQIRTAQAAASVMGLPSIALCLQLAMDTGQRPGDLRALTWNRYVEGHIRLRQSKTGTWVEVPVLPELGIMLSATPRIAPHVLVNEQTGAPYSKDLLSHKVRQVMDAAGLPTTLQMRDLRRTAVVRLAEAGCTSAEISAITGHSIQDTTQILEVYLPRNSAMAKSAFGKVQKMQKLELKKGESEKQLEVSKGLKRGKPL